MLNIRISDDVVVASVKLLVSDYYSIPYDDLMRQNRKPKTVLARQIAMYLVFECSQLNTVQIGKHFAREHSTIIHACKCINKYMEVYPAIVASIKYLCAKLADENILRVPKIKNKQDGRLSRKNQRSKK